jgi:4-amino-4-deoxy-L-arabinose transferase-like glycosyltransferase
VLLFLALAWWSWRKWPDPLIDFGRELYTPWQIARGRVLYRDIASLFGPLSPYLNALWFRLFGVSMMTLAICNMAIFGLIVAGIHRLIREATDAATATTASVVTPLLFGFCQYTEVGNYNFVCPYSHEATHGLALSVGMFLCVQRALGERGAIFWAPAGISFGAILLTKPELALAAAAGVLVACVCAAWLQRSERRVSIRGLVLFLSAGALVPLAFFLYFRFHMPTGDALRAVGGAWVTLFVTGITDNTFYRTGMGLDAPVMNLIRMLTVSAGIIGFLGVAIALSSALARATSRSRLVRLAIPVCLLIVAIRLVPWGSVPRALPIVVVAALVALALHLRETRRDRERADPLVVLIAWSVFALVLLGKMALNARVVHYGFYLALPATTVAIVLIGWVIPSAIEKRRRWANSHAFRAIALWTLAGGIVSYLGASQWVYQRKTLPIGGNGDRFYASTAPGQWHGAAVAAALSELERVATPTGTLAVLPEGVMLNYLLRRDSPLRVTNLMPPELRAFGEEDVQRSLRTAPPDVIVLVHKDMREYGYPMFGSDARYGRHVLDWVNARYRRIAVIRRDPFSKSDPGIEIYVLRTSPVKSRSGRRITEGKVPAATRPAPGRYR